MCASKHSHADIVRQLLEKGANVDVRFKVILLLTLLVGSCQASTCRAA